MGRMTFRDAIAYSRNVVAAKVALAPRHRRPASRRRILYDTWTRLGFGPPTGIDVAGEVAGHRARPGRSRRGARSTSPTARSARASRSRRSSSRRRTRRWSTAGRWSSRTSSGRSATRDVTDRGDGGRVMTPRAVRRRCVGLMQHVVTEVDFYRRPDPRPGLRGRRQDGHRADLGRRTRRRVEGQQASTTRSSATSDARPATRTSWSRSGSRRGRRPSSASGHLEMPVMSFELFRRIAHRRDHARPTCLGRPDDAPIA